MNTDVSDSYPAKPSRLRCEFVADPLGIERPDPQLSWWVSDPRPAELQTSYQILAASNEARLEPGEADLWDSGVVSWHTCTGIRYAGKPLRSSQRVVWKVRTFDSDGVASPWSDAARFEVGLLDARDWVGAWMSAGLSGSRTRGVQAAAMRRAIDINGEIDSARLYVAALGDYVAYVNGEPLGSSGSFPVWSDFSHECYYQTWDLTDRLVPGANALGLLLADGYFCGEIPRLGRGVYGDRAAVRCMLHVTLRSGQALLIPSDHRWRWHTSWVIGSEVNRGEHVDLRQRPRDWAHARFDDADWNTIETVTGFEGRLRALPFTEQVDSGVLEPLARPVVRRPDSDLTAGERYNGYVDFDFGTTCLGRLRLAVHCRGSDNVRIQYSLDAEFSEATQDSFTTPAGPVREQLETTFALHSFRYVRVEYTLGHTEVLDAQAVPLRYPGAAGLTFRSDHETLDALVNTLHSSLENVALSVPMRGVHFEQRLPDMAYAVTWMPRLAEEERAHALVLKWLADIRTALDAQHERGLSASRYVPALPGLDRSQQVDEIALFETYVRTLWALYQHQGDMACLRDGFEHVRVGALAFRHYSDDLLRRDADLELHGTSSSSVLVATCCTYSALRLAARMAHVLGHPADAESIERLAQQLREAWRLRFLTGTGHMAADDASACVAALHHGMLEPQEIGLAQERLFDQLRQARYHADVVPSVSRALLPVLTNAGRLDLAYMVLLQTSQPSWLGDYIAGQQQGHAADIADIGLLEWLIQSAVGLTVADAGDPDAVAYRQVRIEPRPPFGKQFLAGSPLQYVQAAVPTIHGAYEVAWWIRPTCFELKVVVPPGCAAVVIMPDRVERPVHSGTHEFVMNFDAGGDGLPLLVNEG